ACVSVGEDCCRSAFSTIVIWSPKLNVSALRFLVILRSDQCEVHFYPEKRKAPAQMEGDELI
ncbi:MAG: hypothetical protein WA717_08175, partial [Methyloceanibacter sp.]